MAARAREGGRPTLRLTGLGMVLLVGAVVGTTSVAVAYTGDARAADGG